MICTVNDGRYHGRRSERGLVAVIGSSLTHRGSPEQRTFLGNSGRRGDLAMASSSSRTFGSSTRQYDRKLIDHALFDACIGIDSAVAQKWPVRTLFVNASPIYVRGHNFFAIDRPFCNDFAVRPAHKALTPKFNAVPTGRRFMPDAVRHRYVTPIGDRV